MHRYCVSALCSAAVICLVTTGCATTSKGISDEELIMKRVEDAMAAVQAKDLAAFETYVSESFYASVIGDRDDLRAYLEAADSMGVFDDIEIDLSNAVLTVESETATMAPVIISGNVGTERIRFEGKKENGLWLVTSLEPTY